MKQIFNIQKEKSKQNKNTKDNYFQAKKKKKVTKPQVFSNIQTNQIEPFYIILNKSNLSTKEEKKKRTHKTSPG